MSEWVVVVVVAWAVVVGGALAVAVIIRGDDL